MAAKRFRFEPLLDVARQREEQQMREVAALLVVQQAAQDRLDGLTALHEEMTAVLCGQDTNGPLDLPRYGEAVAYLDHLRVLIEEQRVTLAEAEAQVEQARDVLVGILQEKRSLEILEERDIADAAQMESRREDGRVDDLNTQRFGRRTPGIGEGGV
ncbi:MAG: flagellar export protein FliJ [Dehalococcoidia bacterium]|nr:flagellar export protein FliJ [Dehalococcoidia bacterium]